MYCSIGSTPYYVNYCELWNVNTCIVGYNTPSEGVQSLLLYHTEGPEGNSFNSNGENYKTFPAPQRRAAATDPINNRNRLRSYHQVTLVFDPRLPFVYCLQLFQTRTIMSVSFII